MSGCLLGPLIRRKATNNILNHPLCEAMWRGGDERQGYLVGVAVCWAAWLEVQGDMLEPKLLLAMETPFLS
jgi:hypothetical protein